MKRTIIILIGITLLASIGTGIFCYLNKPAELSPERILPEGALLYTRCSNLKSALAEIASTKLWEDLKGLDYDFIMKSAGVREDQRRMIGAVQTQLFNPSLGAMLEKFFGEEFAVAVYPMEFDAAQISLNNPQDVAKALEKLFSNIVLVARVGGDVQLAETMSSLLGRSDQLEIETFVYEGQNIHLMTVPDAGIKIGFVRIKDLLIVGLGDHAARRGVDTYKGKKEALANDGLFLRAKEQSGGPWEMSGYVDLRQVLEFFKGQVGRLTQQLPPQSPVADEGVKGRAWDVQRQWDQIFAQTEAIEMLSFSAHAGAVSKFQFDLFFDKGKALPDMAAVFTCPPSENKTLAFVPQDIMGYQWNNCFDLKGPWQQLKNEAALAQEGGRPVADQLAQIQQTIGVDVEKDVIPAFAGEIGGYLSDIQMGGIFPYPQVVFFVKVKDETKAKEVLEKFKQQIPVVWQSERHKNTAITFLSAPLVSDIQPGYCFLDGYLLVGINTKLLKGSVDARHAAAPSLASSPLFSEMDLGLSSKSRFVQLFKVDRLAGKAQEVIEWVKAWSTSQDAQKEAFKLGGEKRLADTRAAIVQKEGELAELKIRQTALEDDIWNRNSRGEDAGAERAQLGELKEGITLKEREIASDKEQEAELEKILKGYDRPSADQEKRDEISRRVVYPLLQSLSSVKAMGIRTTLNDEVLEANILFKLE